MSSWDSYPKVYNLGHAVLGELLWDFVIVQEKVDGSQFSFARFDDGEIRVRSRGRVFSIDYPDGIFAAACATVKQIAPKLRAGYTYRGEVLASPRHNVLQYSRTPAGHIVLFDINDGQQSFLHPEIVADEAIRLGLEPVNTLYQGPGESLSMITLEGFLAQESSLGGAKVEGVVVKNYLRFARDGKALMGKLVRQEFKEAMRQAQPKNRKDMIASIVETYHTEARFRKAVQHLRERGELLGEPKDIGPLLKELSTDLLEEEGEAIKEALFSRYWKEITKGVSRGFADWYKTELAKEQFKEQETHE